eukprot:COSAG05_NODE_148_length_16365_cov_76.419218_8_plen_48_part_00
MLWMILRQGYLPHISPLLQNLQPNTFHYSHVESGESLILLARPKYYT